MSINTRTSRASAVKQSTPNIYSSTHAHPPHAASQLPSYRAIICPHQRPPRKGTPDSPHGAASPTPPPSRLLPSLHPSSHSENAGRELAQKKTSTASLSLWRRGKSKPPNVVKNTRSPKRKKPINKNPKLKQHQLAPVREQRAQRFLEPRGRLPPRPLPTLRLQRSPSMIKVNGTSAIGCARAKHPTVRRSNHQAIPPT